MLAACVFLWIYKYNVFSELEMDLGDENIYSSIPDKYTWQVYIKDLSGEFKIMPFLAAMVVLMWTRFLLML